MLIKIISEAPTPHNTYFFAAVAGAEDVELEIHYIYRPDRVPGRPWKNNSAEIPGNGKVRCGIGHYFDWQLFYSAIFDRKCIHFVIGWNHPLLFILLTFLGLRRAPLLMWFDTPQPSGGAWWNPKRLLKAWIIRMINRCPGTIFVTGQLAADRMAALGIDPVKIRKLPFFVPSPSGVSHSASSHSIRSRFGIDNDDVVILAAGRMIPSKGFDLLVDALSLAVQHFTLPWTMVLVGSGQESERLEQMVGAAGLKRHVQFVPWLEADHFASLIAAIDIFVAPARFDPFPTTVISAMQSGVTVIASDGVGSALEFVASGTNGIIVPKCSVKDMAEALILVVNSPEIRTRMGESALDTISRWPVQRGVAEVVDASRRAADFPD